jgi:ATP-dependent DNA helicase RecQ
MKGLFAASKKARIWFTVEAEKVAAKLNVPRDRIVKALDWLANQELVELKAEGLLHRYRRLRTADVEALTDDLYERVLAREQAELGRLAAVIDLAASKTCQVQALSRHFSDPTPADPCGHCEHCLTGPIALERTAEIEIDAPNWELAMRLKAEQSALDDPRILARFLCGVRSPLLTRLKLTKHALFGCCEAVPFGKVMQKAVNSVTAKG